MRAGLSLVTLILLSGCVVPLPHKRIHAFGATGQIIDAKSKLPIRDISVSPVDKPQEIVKTNESGWFSIQPVFGWHGAYFFGPIGLSLFPPMDMPAMERKISISKPGYKRTEYTFKAFDTANRVLGPEIISLDRTR